MPQQEAFGLNGSVSRKSGQATARGVSLRIAATHRAETLFGLRIRGGRGGRTMIRGILRRGGRAACGIRGATGYERKGNDGKAGEDDFFHKCICCSDVFLTMRG